MTTFDSTKTELKKLLDEIVEGKLQLPDFQRGWIWDDEHIRSLLVSIARSFPIGAIMLLETGGTVRFQVRPVEGIALQVGKKAERLILDGQQRLTSLTHVLKLQTAVLTRDEKKNEIKRHYYFDISKALDGPPSLDDVVVTVDETRRRLANFDRDVVLDLSSPEREYETFHFPCDQIMQSDAWEVGLHKTRPDLFPRFMEFRQSILDAFRSYQIPLIELKKETSKEAVCLVFEKVNTGGVPLSVFELVTATYAADDFNLRKDWFGEGLIKGRLATLATKPLLKDTAATDFLQGISLLYTYDRQQQDVKAGKSGKEITGVSAKRENILTMPLSAYHLWADKLLQGFLEANQFLQHLGFHNPKFLPYRAQIIPLAAVLTHLGERWLEPQIQAKLSRWFWCGVFGELYGSASDTRIALDIQGLLRWLDTPRSSEPATVLAAGFQLSRLDTMRTRTSAAYRGLYVLLQEQGARDFFWKTRILDLDRNEKAIDIHHIFPRKWCEERGIGPRTYDSIVNKTPISYKANRKIGGKAPSVYLAQLETDRAVQLSTAEMDAILASHHIAAPRLRADQFEFFMADRKARLLSVIEAAMGKVAVRASAANEDSEEDAD